MNRTTLTVTMILLVASSTLWGQLPKRGRIAGLVRYTETVFADREVVWKPGSRATNLALENLLHGKRMIDRRIAVDPENRGLRDCLVTVTGVKASSGRGFVAVVNLRDLTFDQRTVAVPTKGRVLIRNRDPIKWVLVARDAADAVLWRKTLEAGGELSLGAGEKRSLHVAIENFEFAGFTVVPTGNRPATVTTADGKFGFRGVDPGDYKLEIWHPELGTAEAQVRVVPGKIAEVLVDTSTFKDTRPKPALRPFTGIGDPILVVEGVTIGAADLERIVEYLRARGSRVELPRKLLRRQAIERVIIPTAAIFRGRRMWLADLFAKGERISNLLAKGRPFLDVAAAARELGAEVGVLKDKARRDLEPILGEKVFGTAKGVIQGPILGARGLHFFNVLDQRIVGDLETRSFRYIFLPLLPGQSVAQIDAEIVEWAKRARVEVVDESLAEFVSESHRR